MGEIIYLPGSMAPQSDPLETEPHVNGDTTLSGYYRLMSKIVEGRFPLDGCVEIEVDEVLAAIDGLIDEDGRPITS